MRWKSHVRFGGRAGETDRWRQRHGALVRSHSASDRHQFLAGHEMEVWKPGELPGLSNLMMDQSVGLGCVTDTRVDEDPRSWT